MEDSDKRPRRFPVVRDRARILEASDCTTCHGWGWVSLCPVCGRHWDHWWPRLENPPVTGKASTRRSLKRSRRLGPAEDSSCS